jgi:hypothetical protein
MTHKLSMTAAAAAIALALSIGIGAAEADGRGLHGGFIHGGVVHDGDIHRRVNQHRFFGRQGFPGIGFGYDDAIGYGPDVAAEAPPMVNAPQRTPAVLAADRPPCREMTEGVVVMRGTSCSRGAR